MSLTILASSDEHLPTSNTYKADWPLKNDEPRVKKKK